MTADERLNLLREHRAYAERTIERCDGTLTVEHLKPYHAATARQRTDAARLAAHYTAHIERIEQCIHPVQSTNPIHTRTARWSARSIAAYALTRLIQGLFRPV
jgi:hypothetical protein